MRFLALGLALAALAIHAFFYSPHLLEHHTSAATEINVAIWIACLGVVAFAAICLRLAAAPKAEPKQAPASKADVQQQANRVTRAMLDSVALAESPHMVDAFTYGMAAYWMDTGEGPFTFVEVPFADLIKHAEAEHLRQRAVDEIKASDQMKSDGPASVDKPRIIGLDLAKPGAERTVILKARQCGISSAIERARVAIPAGLAKADTAKARQHAKSAAAKRAKREQRNARHAAMGAA